MQNLSIRKVLLLAAALAIAALNIVHLVLPAVTSMLSSQVLAAINTGVAVVIVVLHTLQENGIISEKDVPGLDAVLAAVNGITSVTHKVGDTSITTTNVSITPDAAAVPAAPSATPERSVP